MQVQQTRYGGIEYLDLSNYNTWLDAGENRYEKVGIRHTFWVTLDAKLVAATFKLPQPLGAMARIILAGFGPTICAAGWFLLSSWAFWLLLLLLVPFGTNRYEPFPIGNWKHGDTMWMIEPHYMRWLKWHIRNPLADLRKFYMGFAYAEDVKHRPKPWGVVRWANFRPLSFRVPFPDYDGEWIGIGWKQRGIASIGLHFLKKFFDRITNKE